MRRFATLVAITVLAVSACSSSGGAATRTQLSAAEASASVAAACRDNGFFYGKFNGHYSTTYCGSTASAVVKIGATTRTISGGDCLDATAAGGGWTMDIGTHVNLIVGETPAPNSPDGISGLFLERSNNTLQGVVADRAFRIGNGYDGATVTFAADHKTGTASGTTDDGQAITVAWTCQ